MDILTEKMDTELIETNIELAYTTGIAEANAELWNLDLSKIIRVNEDEEIS